MAPASVVTWSGAERESGERTRVPYLEADESGPPLEADAFLAETTAALGTLASGVAHEINNALTYLLLDVDRVHRRLRELAATTSPDDDVLLEDELASNIRALARAMDGARRIQKIVRDLTRFSQADVTPCAPIDVRGILEAALQLASHEIVPRARLTRNLAYVPPVAANEAHLAQVFLSLLVHAARAIPEGHADENEVLVSTCFDGEHLFVEIAETGASVPLAGLELSVAHGFVSAMGGDLSARSEAGRGTTFRVTLSAARRYLQAQS